MDLVQIKNNQNNQIVKANKLIEAMGELSLTATKMLAMLIAMIRNDDTEFQEYALHIDTYLKQIDSKSQNREFVKEKALELMRNPFYILNTNGKKEFFNWCSKVSPYNIDGYIVFSIHYDLKPHLLNLKSKGNFTKYHITNILSLRGSYTPKIYEYFLMQFNEYKFSYKKSYNKNPKSYLLKIDIDWLRDYLIIPKSYRYSDIKKQIIEIAKKQFEEKTDIKFTYKEEKLGRKVIKLEIKLENNNKGSNDFLMDIYSFIRYMRKEYVNHDVWKGQGMILSIDHKGLIYDKKTLIEYKKNDAQKVWNIWYDLAKDNKLSILN